METPILMAWYGKNVDDMTREELLVALRKIASMLHAADLLRRERDLDRLHEMQQLTRG